MYSAWVYNKRIIFSAVCSLCQDVLRLITSVSLYCLGCSAFVHSEKNVTSFGANLPAVQPSVRLSHNPVTELFV